MAPDLFFIIICSVLGLIAHGSRKARWLEFVLRGIILLFVAGFGMSMVIGASTTEWSNQVSLGMSIFFFLLLFKPFRQMMSRVFTLIDGIVSLRCITGPVRHRMKVFESIVTNKIFIAESMPHLNGLFCYAVCFGVYLSSTDLSKRAFDMPNIPLPGLPIPVDQLLQYNGLGLVFVSMCGCGILVSRRFKETFVHRLGWAKPTGPQIAIALAVVVLSATYDLVWANFTHAAAPNIATQISGYNSGTFSAGTNNLAGAAFLALMTAICAGVGEETLIRGAFQPVVGILPAAFLHGILHAQFSQSPVLILQIAIWSCGMGIVRRFTNTTTTIIAHGLYNLVFTFLFAFNPG